MDMNNPKNQSNTQRNQYSTNPFARALAEMENSSYENTQANSNSLFRDALMKNRGTQADSFKSSDTNNDLLKRQQEELERKKRQEALKKKLHDQVNPVDQQDVFNAREQQVKKEIDKIRQELRLLAKDVAKFQKDVELTLMTEISDPGEKGVYFLNFFHQLRAFIMLLRQKIKSASTWAHQMNSKSKKKSKKGSSMSLKGKTGHQQTKTIFDMMHHEVSNARSGG